MGQLFENFATSRKHEAEGIFIEVSAAKPATDDSPAVKAVRFRIARRNRQNKRWRKMFDAETKPYAQQIKNENLDPEIDNQISVKIFCHTILLGWEGVTNENHVFNDGDESAEVPYTPDNGIKLMTALPDLYEMLNENSAKASNFRDEQREEDAKNS